MTNQEPANHGHDPLCRVATLSNLLAKQLSGRERTLAYQIKAEALSGLILRGDAWVNGVRPGGIIALSVSGDPPFRVHIRESHLTPAARQEAAQQARIVPTVAPLAESLSGEMPTGLKTFQETKRRKI